MQKTVYILLLAAAIGLAVNTHNKPPVFEHYYVENGLSNVTVYSIIQDDAGFLWFGTANGLNRFDGYEFKSFGYDAEDSTSLSNNSAGNIYKGKDGSIWVGTWGGGLNRFDPVTEKAERFLFNPSDSTSISGRRVQCIFEDSKHRVWAGTYISGLNLLDRKTGTFTHFKHKAGNAATLANNRIWAITEDSQGKLWVATSNGLDCFDPEEQKVIQHVDQTNGLSNSIVRSLYMARDNILWVGTQNGLTRFDINSNTFRTYLHENVIETRSNRGRINALLEDREGFLWLATGYGLVYFDPNTGKYQRFTHDEKVIKSLSDDEVRSVFQDKNDLLWFGTRGRGIDKYNPHKKPFNNINLATKPGSESKANTVLGIAGTKDFLFVGTLDGFVKINRNNGARQRFYASVKGENTKEKGIIRTVLIPRGNTTSIWIGLNAGFSKYDASNDTFEFYGLPVHSPAGMVYKRILSIYSQSKDILWFGDYNAGLNMYNLQTGKVEKQYVHDDENPESISFNEIWFIEPDSGGTMWIGTGAGLNHFNVEKETFKKYFFAEKLRHSTAVFCMAKTPEGFFWLGTDYGLIYFDPKTGNYKNYNKKNGLQDEIINSILLDAQGNVWMGTGNGLTMFNPKTEQATNFGVTDGLSNQDYLTSAAYEAQDGQMFFGGSRGIDCFYPEEIQINTNPPPIVLTQFRVLNKRIKPKQGGRLSKAINYTYHISLRHQDYLFSFEFAALDYTNPLKNKYAYKLEGVDKDWIYTDARNRTATYTNLPGGLYSFRVKGSNADGIWNENGASIEVQIIPPFWQTWPFRIGIILIIGSFIILFFRLRTASIKKRSRELEALNIKLTNEIRDRKRAEQEKDRLQEQLSQAQKMEALGTLAGGMAHDFNNLLTVISGHSEVALLDTSIPDKFEKHFKAIQNSSKRAENLTRQLLALGRKQLIQARVLDINQTIEEAENILRRLIPADIHFEKYFGDHLPLIEADPGQIEQILLNLFINARDAINAKNDPQQDRRIILTTRLVSADEMRKSGITLSEETTYIGISVTDTGKGMSAEVQEHIFEPFFTTKELNRGTGLGLATVYGIVSQNKAFITLESAPEKGSTFHIFWPATKSKRVTEPQELSSEIKELRGHEHILLVEDEVSVREFTQNALESLGYRVAVAENGIEALTIIRSGKTFDLLISDLIMPEMNGQELAQELKRSNISIPVLFISGYTFEHLQKEGRLEDDINFLKKPFTIKNLAQKIKTILKAGTLDKNR